MFAPLHRARHLISLALALILGALLAFSAAGSVAAAASPSSTVLAVVRTAGATLYNATGTALRELPAGTRLTSDGRSPDSRWLHVETQDGEEGWVSRARVVAFGLSNLAVMADAPALASAAGINATAAPTVTVNTSGGRLNVRAGPGTSYPVVATLAAGETWPALARSQDGAWIQVPARRGEGFGWVSASFVAVNGDAQALPVSAEISDLPAEAAGPAPAQPASDLSGTIVFQERSGGKIYAYDVASGNIRHIANGADPALSPDGRQVAFWRDEHGQHHLFTVNSDGGAEQRILTRGEMLRAPAWSPEGQRIVFSRVVGQGRCRDVGYGICVPDVPPYSLMFPLVTSDQWGLSSVDARGDDFRDLQAQFDAIAPSWGEVGIVYDGPAGIEITADSDDSENRQLLDNFRFHDPAWQPGGGRIVFQSLEKDHWEIFSAASDGSNVTALTRPTTTLAESMPHNVAPVWSPDGRQILFLSNRGGAWAFWVMNADGSGQRKLPLDAPIAYDYQMEQVASWQ